MDANTLKSRWIQATVVAVVLALAAGRAGAQDGSLMNITPVNAQLAPSQGATLENSSFIYRELPPESRVNELRHHDIITVLVDYRTRMLSEGDAEQRKTSNLTAVLSSWIRFDGKSIKAAPQTDGDPRVAGTYNSQSRAESDVELRDTLSFEIACEIIEIRPNGNLYIEGNQTIRNNEEQWRIFVSGEVRREAIQPDRTVSSRSIVNLNIDKEEVGAVRDGYARGWFSKWYDRYKPF
jgi:flagellar L-ring protein precursor FlgH